MGVIVVIFVIVVISIMMVVVVSVWRRVVVFGLFIFVGSDFCWIGSIRVFYYGIRRVRFFFFLLRGLCSVRGRGRGGLLFGSLSSVIFLLLLLLLWVIFVV